MDRWTGILKVPVRPRGISHCRIAASLCISRSSKVPIVPAANAIFFLGDRVEGTGNPVIERLSDMQNVAEILVSKFGASINAWVIEASTFNGPFAVYKEFIPSLNKWGEPQCYRPNGFPASTSVITLLSKFLEERAKNIDQGGDHHHASYDIQSTEDPTQPKDGSFFKNPILPSSRESLFDSISEIHYVDVGLNSPGAYLTDKTVIERIAEQVIRKEKPMRFVLHGTPRQWRDPMRVWIREEKDKLHQLLESEAKKSGGRLQVCERMYFANESPNLQMHFEIIEKLVVS
uniref:Uncharacterized protein n=1 Tax=Opuntia streptacantha TaxID=393608 RepID=A0A7C9DAW1_OPUST